jgi:hypothetical protein
VKSTSFIFPKGARGYDARHITQWRIRAAAARVMLVLPKFLSDFLPPFST